jgi:hypothetical protein
VTQRRTCSLFSILGVCYPLVPMLDLLAALDAFLQEHRRCGDLDGGVEGERVWMTCDCGAAIVQPVENDAPDPIDGASRPQVPKTISRGDE